MNIKVLDYDKELANKLSQELNIDKDIIGFLLGRGYDSSYIRLLTSKKYLDMISNNSLTNVDKAASKIQQHLINNTNIYIFGDYDSDGVNSVYIMYQALVELSQALESKSEISYYLPERREGYGLSMQWCETIPSGSFVITVDNGITKRFEVDYLLENDIDVLITDHHQPQQGYTPNCTIVDAFNYSNSTSNDKGLCGAAVAYKIIAYLYQDIYGYDFDVVSKYLPHVAVATITDMMPVTKENIILINNGLKLLNEYPFSNREFLPISEAMYYFADYNKGSDISPKDIAFGFGPQINSCGRLGNVQDALNFMLADDYEEIQDYYEVMVSVNDKRKELTNQIAQSMESPKPTELAMVRIIDSNEGLAGNIANKMLDIFGLVTIIFHENGDMLSGSARSPQGLDLQVLLSNNKYTEAFGGHERAAGVSIKKENLESFKEELFKAILSIPVTPILDNTVYVDKIIDTKDLNKYMVEKYNNVLYFNELRKPVFYLEDADVSGYGHSKNNENNIYFNFTDGKKQYKVWSWGFGETIKRLCKPNKVNMTFTLEVFKGMLVADVLSIEVAN